ncbi:MAG: arylesterase [Gammaproteobacteria bacterium]
MKRFLVALLLLFTLPVLAENTILIVGDSISAGYGINPADGWVSLLEQRLKKENYSYRVINASISGDTLSNGLERIPAALQKYHPQITIIELGGNDGLRGLQLVAIKNNLEQIINRVKAANSKVLVLGMRLPPNYGAAYTQQFMQIFSALSERKDISVVPLFLTGVDDQSPLMQSDGIHPLAMAQPILLNNVWPMLRPLLVK